MEEQTDQVIETEDAKHRLQRQLAELEQRYGSMCTRTATAEEMWRQLHAQLQPSTTEINQVGFLPSNRVS
jgi:hypothetical protein